jgi:hypothetical protein
MISFFRKDGGDLLLEGKIFLFWGVKRCWRHYLWTFHKQEEYDKLCIKLVYVSCGNVTELIKFKMFYVDGVAHCLKLLFWTLFIAQVY